LDCNGNKPSKEACLSTSEFTNYAFDSSLDPHTESAQLPKTTPKSSSMGTQKTWMKRFLFIICCAVQSGNNTSTNYEVEHIRRESREAASKAVLDATERAIEDAKSAHDDPHWKNWLNLCAMIVISIATFLFGYFA